VDDGDHVATISVHIARAEFSRLIERAIAGEEIVITRRGKPAVRLMPVEESRPRRKPGTLKGKFELPDGFFDPLPDEVINAFYNSKIFPDEQ
jgi:prevent-host-death family protein